MCRWKINSIQNIVGEKNETEEGGIEKREG